MKHENLFWPSQISSSIHNARKRPIGTSSSSGDGVFQSCNYSANKFVVSQVRSTHRSQGSYLRYSHDGNVLKSVLVSSCKMHFRECQDDLCIAIVLTLGAVESVGVVRLFSVCSLGVH